jgi:hypothetical protein
MNREQREQCILALTSLVECADDDQALAAGCKAQGVDSHQIGDPLIMQIVLKYRTGCGFWVMIRR